jgi:hypothetical protein
MVKVPLVCVWTYILNRIELVGELDLLELSAELYCNFRLTCFIQNKDPEGKLTHQKLGYGPMAYADSRLQHYFGATAFVRQSVGRGRRGDVFPWVSLAAQSAMSNQRPSLASLFDKAGFWFLCEITWPAMVLGYADFAQFTLYFRPCDVHLAVPARHRAVKPAPNEKVQGRAA